LVPAPHAIEAWGPGSRTRAFRDLLWTPFCEAMQQDVRVAWQTPPLRRPDSAVVAREAGRDWALIDGHLARVGERLSSATREALAFEDGPAFALAP
jgi:hypothetical protein